MNMPVLPATSSSPTPADAVRVADASASSDAPVFSNVLSGQRDTASAGKQPADALRTGKASTDPSKSRDPLGPGDALALILDAAALPLMQAAATPEARVRFSVAGAAAMNDARTGGSAKTPASKGPSSNDPRLNVLSTLDTADKIDPQQAGKTDATQVKDRIDPRLAAQTSQPTQGLLTESDNKPRHQANHTTTLPGGTLRVGNISVGHDPRAPILSDTQNLIGTDGARPATQASASPLGATAQPDALLAAQAGLSGTGAALLPPAAHSTAQAPLFISVPSPLNSPQWPQDFSRQVLSLTQANAGGHTVMMQVNPPELGPVRIALHLGDSIQASFISPHASVRQALENALPHLQQQLAEAGLSLGQADVSDHQSGQQQAGASSSGPGNSDGAVFSLDGGADSVTGATQIAAPAQHRAHPDALVDTFA